MDNSTLSAGEFKATCLKVMDEVAATGREVIITKRGRPVARLVPMAPELEAPRRSLFGALKDVTQIIGDIEAPLTYAWRDSAEKFLQLAEPTPKALRPKKRRS